MMIPSLVALLAAIAADHRRSGWDVVRLDGWSDERDDLLSQVEALFRCSGVRIASDEEPRFVVVDEDDRVLGALVASRRRSEEYGVDVVRFSIAVAEEARRRGIARRLCIEIERDVEDDGEPVLLEEWVINPFMASLSLDLGYDGRSTYNEYDPYYTKLVGVRR